LRGAGIQPGHGQGTIEIRKRLIGAPAKLDDGTDRERPAERHAEQLDRMSAAFERLLAAVVEIVGRGLDAMEVERRGLERCRGLVLRGQS
jgi:hypothetical protein